MGGLWEKVYVKTDNWNLGSIIKLHHNESECSSFYFSEFRLAHLWNIVSFLNYVTKWSWYSNKSITGHCLINHRSINWWFHYFNVWVITSVKLSIIKFGKYDSHTESEVLKLWLFWSGRKFRALLAKPSSSKWKGLIICF